ncbi:hypothetical protein F5884DRAFT_842590 [Xylogone sp. PMI_703]|nr:hypothetical protein F5884DRAFT_842590 [Xylogone sp. PMI_703]
MAFPNPTSKYHHDPTPITDPTQKHLSVAGKIVLVTGGGTAIGAATVEAFSKAQAAHVFLVGRRFQLLENVTNKLSPQYPQTKFHPIAVDITRETEISSLFKEIKKVGPIDILIANAGYLSEPGPIATSDTTEWWKSFETNVFGTYLLSKYFLNQQPAPKGTPIFISVNTGVAHLGPLAGHMSAYGTSKLAAASLVEFLDTEYPHIKAFNISPGVIKSEMADKANNPNFPPTDSPYLPANLMVWLSSPESDFLKGKFIWANWDIEELVKAKDKITANPSSLRLSLEGWWDGFSKLK